MKDPNSPFPMRWRSLLLSLFFGYAGVASGADTTAPTIPTNFSAVVNSCSRVDLSWAPATDPKGSQSGLAGYKVYRNSSLISTLGLITTFSDASLAANAVYTYQVSAVDISGNESLPSTALSVAPCPDNTAPSMPANLTAAVAGPSQVDLSWGTSTDGAGRAYEAISGLKGYQIFRNGTNANNKIADIHGSATSYSDSSLSANSTVYYAVRGIDNSNNISG